MGLVRNGGRALRFSIGPVCLRSCAATPERGPVRRLGRRGVDPDALSLCDQFSQAQHRAVACWVSFSIASMIRRKWLPFSKDTFLAVVLGKAQFKIEK